MYLFKRGWTAHIPTKIVVGGCSVTAGGSRIILVFVYKTTDSTLWLRFKMVIVAIADTFIVSGGMREDIIDGSRHRFVLRFSGKAANNTAFTSVMGTCALTINSLSPLRSTAGFPRRARPVFRPPVLQ